MNLLFLAAVIVESLTGLEKPASWISESSALYPLSSYEGRLEVGVNGTQKEGVKRISLKHPVVVPDGCDLHFQMMRPGFHSLFLRAVVRDARGSEYAVWTSGRYHLAKSNAFGGQFRPDIVMMASGEWRATARFSNVTRENCMPLNGARLPVKRPLTFVGLDLCPESDKASQNQKVWLRNFRLSNANDANGVGYLIERSSYVV